MSTFYSVDSDGNRIMTDILVSGYIHDHETEYEVIIPQEIVGVTFMFWLIQFCDFWDHSLCHEVADINGQHVKLKEDVASIFGIQSITKGSFEWRIKFITDINWICIGIIKDDPEILRKYLTENEYARNGDGIFVFCDKYGGFFCQNWEIDVCQVRRDKDTVVSMSLNMNAKTICYEFDGKMAVNRKIEIAGNKYRLVVTMPSDDNQEIQLL